MKHSYIIIDDDQEEILKTHAVATRFPNLQFVGFAHNYDEGINLILEHNPKIVFLEIDPTDKESRLSLQLINEIHRYLKIIPKFIVITKKMDLAFEAIKFEVFDYFTKPLEFNQFRKTILKFEKAIVEIPQFYTDTSVAVDPLLKISQELIQNAIGNDEKPETSDIPDNNLEIEPENLSILQGPDDTDAEETNVFDPNKSDEKPLIICVKSYGDYRFIEAKDICYLQADNNSTDIHLSNGEMVTAFKTLKHFEGVLSSPFVRIHNSYIVNINFVSRIHTGNAICYIKNTATKLPFSKSYKENVDAIINSITNGNYLEI